MTVRRKSHARNNEAAFGQRSVHSEFVVVAVQIVDVLSDDFTLEILPRTVADAVACIDRRLPVDCLGAQIGMPGFTSGPNGPRIELKDILEWCSQQARNVG